MSVNYARFFLRYLLAGTVIWGASYLALIVSPLAGLSALILGLGLVYAFKDTQVSHRYTAHFATRAELRRLTDDPAHGDGVLIGFAYRQLLAVRPGMAGKSEIGSFLWVAPSRAGKGLSIACNLEQWEGSALVVDIKGELAEQTAGYREQVLGQRVFILNPSSGEPSHQFDPFAELVTDEQIMSAALAFMAPDKDGDNAIFGTRAASALAAVIKAAKIQGEPVIPYLDGVLFDPKGVSGATLKLHRIGDAQITKWLNSFLSKNPDQMDWAAAASDRFLNNSWQRLITSASVLTTAGVMHLTGGSDFTAADLMDDRVSVYLVFREAELELNLPLLNLMVDALFRSMMRRYDLSSARPYQKLLVINDEAYRAKLNKLPEYVATVAGRGISLCLYVQSIAQLADVWGREGQTAIMENVHTKVFLPAVDRSEANKDGTSAYVAASCGQYLLEERGLGKDEHEHALHSNVRQTATELLSASEFALLPVGQSVIISNNLPPILAYRLEPWRLRYHAQAEQLPAPVPPAPPPRPRSAGTIASAPKLMGPAGHDPGELEPSTTKAPDDSLVWDV